MRPELEAEINRLFSASSGRYLAMKKLSILYVVLCMSLSLGFSTAAFSRGGGGMGGHHSSTTGGAFGTSPTAPGTNSAGTALSSSGTGSMEKGRRWVPAIPPPTGKTARSPRSWSRSAGDVEVDIAISP
jgi:hypothetical protein